VRDVSVRDAVPGDAEITAVYVHPSVAREGVGSRIADELEARARAAGATVVGLTASLPAVPFYASRGYERVEERTHEFSAGAETGVTGTVVELRRPF
jgi:putative acetyltransferase